MFDWSPFSETTYQKSIEEKEEEFNNVVSISMHIILLGLIKFCYNLSKFLCRENLQTMLVLLLFLTFYKILL